jgi:hypothetical protein
MKLRDAHFDEYIAKGKSDPLHPALLGRYARFPDDLRDMCNVIFYGPRGVGKYTQMLLALQKYSPSGMKYEKRISVACGKGTHTFRISDVHFEVDMSLLGCNSRALWSDVYNQILDIIAARADNVGVIVCKYFHETHSELLETFYSYMQTSPSSSVDVKFVLLSEHVGFIPDNVAQRCHMVRVPRPSRSAYARAAGLSSRAELDPRKVLNVKELEAGRGTSSPAPHVATCDELVDLIREPAAMKFALLREKLYDVFIYDMNVPACVWYIYARLVREGDINSEAADDALLRVLRFFQHFNNNYRPIYHLETYILYLCKEVHGFQCSVPGSGATGTVH